MRYLHTMVRVKDLDQSLEFYCNKLGMIEVPQDRERERPLHQFIPGTGGSSNGGIVKVAGLRTYLQLGYRGLYGRP